MRLFLAVPLSEILRASIGDAIERLRQCDADVRWVETENLHLTVAFLGDRTPEQLPEIEAISETVAGGTLPFRISVRGLSAFPRRGPALKTLYAGLSDGAVDWTDLAKRAQSEFAPLGIPSGNDLVPHLTLGRVRGERGIESLRAALLGEAETEFGEQEADGMVLIESKLNPSGAIYQNVRTCRFSALETK